MTNASLSIKKYGRYFGAYEGSELIAVCLYRKGATRLIERLTEALSKQDDSQQKASIQEVTKL
jgi:hypothetical protein